MQVRLSDVLSVDTILLRSAWPDFRACVDGMLGALVTVDRLPAEQLRPAGKLVCEREEIASTAMVDIGVSIPHARFAGVDGITAALAACPQGVYDHGLGLPIEIVVLVLTSPALTTEHLRFLASLSELLQSERTRRAIVQAASAQQVLALIAEQERGGVRAAG